MFSITKKINKRKDFSPEGRGDKKKDSLGENVPVISYKWGI